MAKEYTNQHIVPKCYLDRFAETTNNKHIIGTRYIDSNGIPKLFKRSTTDVGYIKSHYDVNDKTDQKYWEHFLAKQIDSLCDKPLANLLSVIKLSSNYILSSEDKRTLSKIILAQLFRGPEGLNHLQKNIYPKVSQSVKQGFYVSFPPRIVEKCKAQVAAYEMTPQEQKENYFNFCFNEKNFDKYVNILVNKCWIVYVNTKSQALPFVTSDNPVLVENLFYPDKIGLYANGLANPNACFFLSLSPSVAVSLYSEKGLLAPVFEEINGKIILLTNDDINFIRCKNILIMNQAYKHSFIPEPFFSKIYIDEKSNT